MSDSEKRPLSPKESLKQLINSPIFALREFERRPKAKPLSDEERKTYLRLIASLKARNGYLSEAEQLLSLVKVNSQGGARALRGTPFKEIRQQVRELIEEYILQEHDYKLPPRSPHPVKPRGPEPSYVSPLALGESQDNEDIARLVVALNFQPKHRDLVPQDVSFRVAAAESLGTVDHWVARRDLLRVVLDAGDHLRVREACRESLVRTVDAATLEDYRWVRETSRKRALGRLARESGGRPLFTSKKKYERVLDDLLLLFEKADSRPPTEAKTVDEGPARTPGERLYEPAVGFKPLPGSQTLPSFPSEQEVMANLKAEAAKRKASPPTSPTKASPVAPAPPDSGRQAGGERPKAGSDEGDSSSVPPKRRRRKHLGHVTAYCEPCLVMLNAEGLLPSGTLRNYRATSAEDCVRCRVRMAESRPSLSEA